MSDRQDTDSGKGTFGMSQAFYDRCKVSGTPNVIEESFSVYLPEDTDHHLAERGEFGELAENVGMRRFEEKHGQHPRGRRVDEVALRPGDDEYRGIWIVTCSTDYYPGSGPDHQHRWSDRLKDDGGDE